MYHVSPLTGLQKLDPKYKEETSLGEEKILFFSPTPEFAIAFIIRPDELFRGRYAHSSYDGTTWYLIVDNEEKLRGAFKKGGSLYRVSGEFTPYPKAGVGDLVQVSTGSVEVLEEESWDTALAAMLHYNLRIHILPKGTLDTFSSLAGEEQQKILEEATLAPDGIFHIRALKTS